MRQFRITRLSPLQILDSRGRPTLRVSIALANGAHASAGVPSGASTETREAVELRDGEPARFDGQSVQAAVAAVGLALADVPPRLPAPHFNVINGGAHAANPLDFQEFMLAPLGAPDLDSAVRAGAEVCAALRHRLADAGHSVGLGDEGGFAPDIAQPENVLRELVAAISDAGYTAGLNGVAIALDPAASEFRGSERVEKYNRLLEIADQLPSLPYGLAPRANP